jgi:hypothetical protein
MSKIEKLKRNSNKSTVKRKTWVSTTKWQNNMGNVRLCITDLDQIMIMLRGRKYRKSSHWTKVCVFNKTIKSRTMDP